MAMIDAKMTTSTVETRKLRAIIRSKVSSIAPRDERAGERGAEHDSIRRHRTGAPLHVDQPEQRAVRLDAGEAERTGSARVVQSHGHHACELHRRHTGQP